MTRSASTIESTCWEKLSAPNPSGWDEGMYFITLVDDFGRSSKTSVYLPKFDTNKSLGALICLHGAGSVGETLIDNFKQFANQTYMAVICPTAKAPPEGKNNLDLAGLFSKKFNHPRWTHSQNGFPLRALKWACLLYTSPSPRDATLSRMPSSA